MKALLAIATLSLSIGLVATWHRVNDLEAQIAAKETHIMCEMRRYPTNYCAAWRAEQSKIAATARASFIGFGKALLSKVTQ